MNNNPRITLYRADTTGNAQNCLYRHEVHAETEQQLSDALRFDHVFVKFEGNRRRNGNFLYADLLVLDCDNDHSDRRADWVSPEDLAEFLPDVSFVTYSSRHDNLPKGSRCARPRFHAIFPIGRIEDASVYAGLKQQTADLLPFFDRNALDAGRFFFGVEKAKVCFHEGSKLLTEWLEDERSDCPPADAIPEGQRNRTLYRFAVKTLKHLGNAETAASAFWEEAKKCSPPLGEEELGRIWGSACKFYQVIRSRPDYIPPEDYHSASEPKWAEPIALTQPDLETFPVDALPKTIADIVEAAAESLQVSPDMPAVCALGALSVCVQKKYAVRIHDDWVEPVNLYLLVVAKPSERKSPCLKLMTDPIDRFEAEWNREHAAEIEASRREKNALIRRVNTLEKKYADGKAEREELEKAVREEQRYTASEPLRLFLDDVTPEKLAAQMAANGGVCAIKSTEGGIFEILAGRYSGDANFDVALKAYSADTIRVDRATKPCITIDKPALTLLLMVQPDVLSGIMSNQAFRGRGLTARILYSIPKSLVGTRDINPKPVPPELKQNYEDLLYRLLCIEQGQTEEILLSPGAEHLRQCFAREVEKALLKEYADMEDWAGKIVGTTMRIAALLCIAEAGPEDLVESWELLPHYEITQLQMAKAITIAAYFIDHAKAAYYAMSDESLLGQGRRVLEAVKEKKLTVITRRDIMQMCRFLRKAEATQKVIDLLEDYGYLVIKNADERPKIGRPGNPLYYVNPLIYTKKLPGAA